MQAVTIKGGIGCDDRINTCIEGNRDDVGDLCIRQVRRNLEKDRDAFAKGVSGFKNAIQKRA